MTLRMRDAAPALSVATVGGGTWTLADAKPRAFTMIVFYRSLHCPVCKRYLGQMEAKLDDFAALGVDVVAISMDTEARAAEAKREWGLEHLTVGYGLSLETARAWGLFITNGQNAEQPAIFSEPGLFLIDPAGALYYAAVSSSPMGRPPVDELIGGIKRAIELKVPARGDA